MVAGQDNAYSLADAIALVTRNPAQASNLFDRGELKTGLRADLVQVHPHAVMPIIQRTWREGRRVF